MFTTVRPRWFCLLSGGIMICLLLSTSLTMANDDDEVTFSIDQTVECVEGIEASSPNRGDHAVLACVGQSAQACMMAPGGGHTFGMISCLSAEAEYWDERMAEAYDEALAAAQSNDEELQRVGSAAPSITETLQARQEAWLSFRQAACRHEQALWMGGTGAGPATQACYMHETARHSLRLEGWFSF